MSVTLRPTAGQHTAYYYNKFDPDVDYAADVKVHGRSIDHGIVRTEDSKPEINMANGNFMAVADMLGITRFYTNGYLHGTIPNAELQALLTYLIEFGVGTLDDHYYTGLYQVIACAIHHGADVSFG